MTHEEHRAPLTFFVCAQYGPGLLVLTEEAVQQEKANVLAGPFSTLIEALKVATEMGTNPGKSELRTTAIQLAKVAIAYEQAFRVFFPYAAEQIAELASKVFAAAGVRYWISPGGDTITCGKCRKTSNHPKDVENRFCGFCHEFMEGVA